MAEFDRRRSLTAARMCTKWETGISRQTPNECSPERGNVRVRPMKRPTLKQSEVPYKEEYSYLSLLHTQLHGICRGGVITLLTKEEEE